jgi:hypothetical protein
MTPPLIGIEGCVCLIYRLLKKKKKNISEKNLLPKVLQSISAFMRPPFELVSVVRVPFDIA